MMFSWLLIVIGLGGLAAWLAQQRATKQSGNSSQPTALDILRERYARGEIDRDEYARMRRDLGASGSED
jgi:putative membrane protein